MGVICNGPRKAGTHALTEVVKEFGFKRCPGGIIGNQGSAGINANGDRIWESLESTLARVGQSGTLGSHAPGLNVPDDHKIITILREPKNIAVSYFRAFVGADNFGRFIHDRGRWFVTITKPYWDNPGERALVVWYEQLFDRNTLEIIANHLNVEYRDVSNAYGRSSAWTGSPSDWREWFTPELRDTFEDYWNEVL